MSSSAMTDFLVQELDVEIATTRRALERVPADKGPFVPHTKSMPLNRLAPHVAQLPRFGHTVLTTPALDFSKGSFTPLPFEGPAQLVRAFDDGAATLRSALAGMSDSGWNDGWSLSFEGRRIYSGSRFLAYRQMFLNHLVHHRAQLGVYLRLNDVPVPATYGPSADDTGF